MKDVTIIKYGDPLKGAYDSVEKANVEILAKVTSQAKSLSPVDKGKLRGSLMWKTDKQAGGYEKGNKLQEHPKPLSGVVGSATEYAAYVEFGTRRQRAQPFLRPAVIIEVNGPNGLNTMKQESIKAMTKALLKGRKTL